MERQINLGKIQCAWCCDQATWTIFDDFGVDQACTAHGSEWWPSLFPESDTTPIETIIQSIPVHDSLSIWDLADII